MDNINQPHLLTNSWCLWAHMPADSDWSPQSYIKIYTFNTVEEMISITETLASTEVLIKSCMLFLMKDNILPFWEDKNNINGGCFTYKVSNKIVVDSWKKLTYSAVGNTITQNAEFNKNINGITISPKKNFGVLKVWMKTCEHQNPDMINSTIPGIKRDGSIFKKHDPTY